jgi:hypothetical protein
MGHSGFHSSYVSAGSSQSPTRSLAGADPLSPVRPPPQRAAPSPPATPIREARHTPLRTGTKPRRKPPPPALGAGETGSLHESHLAVCNALDHLDSTPSPKDHRSISRVEASPDSSVAQFVTSIALRRPLPVHSAKPGTLRENVLRARRLAEALRRSGTGDSIHTVIVGEADDAASARVHGEFPSAFGSAPAEFEGETEHSFRHTDTGWLYNVHTRQYTRPGDSRAFVCRTFQVPSTMGVVVGCFFEGSPDTTV